MQHLQPNTTLQGGKYRIERVLGQGGFGITYLATTIDQGANVQPPKIAFKNVAIKELFIASNGQAINGRRGNQVTVTNVINQQIFEQHKAKFIKEAKRLLSFDHPNIVKVYECFEENNTVYYSMEYIDGVSLRDKMNGKIALPEYLVHTYLNQLLSALEAVHKENIWHLDIKPENIMVDNKERLYLIDFGASKHIEQAGTLTTSSMMSFTPGYYPPEQIAADMHNIGAWTDIYALGATLYNLVTGCTPPSFSSIISDGANAYSFPSYVSNQMQRLIMWMMKVDRNERPQSVAEILDSMSHDEGTLVIGVSTDLESEALTYYEKNDIKILNQYGFFETKKKRQASTIWVSCMACLIISFIVGMIVSVSLGFEPFSLGANIICLLAVVIGMYPGLTIGPAILGVNDKNQLNDLAENIKKQFVKDYIKEHSK